MDIVIANAISIIFTVGLVAIANKVTVVKPAVDKLAEVKSIQELTLDELRAQIEELKATIRELRGEINGKNHS